MTLSDFKKKQILFVIIAILVEYHLPFISMSPTYALSVPVVSASFQVYRASQRGTIQRDILLRKTPYAIGYRVQYGVPRLISVAYNQTKTVRQTITAAVFFPEHLLTTVTAYSSTKDQTDDSPCITANGYNVCAHNVEDIIATNMLPFGTHVQLPQLFGDKEFVVQDRMHARYTNRVDIWMKTRESAKQFGIKRSVTLVVVQKTAPSIKLTPSSPRQIAINF